MKVHTIIKKVGFTVDKISVLSQNQPEEAVASTENLEPIEEIALNNIWDRLRQIYSDSVLSDMIDYIDVKKETEMSPHLNEEQIIRVIMEPVVEGEIGSDKKEVKFELQLKDPSQS